MFSCTTNSTKFSNRSPISSKGFAYIYNDVDHANNLIKGKLDNTKLQVSHSSLKINSLIKIINPKTKESIIIKNLKRTTYPNFYKILITKEVSKKLKLDPELPFVEVLEIKKNKSFVAKKAKIFNEEKKISSNAPVTSVKISNISKYKKNKENFKKDKFFILIGIFYSEKTADFLKKRIIKEVPIYDMNKLLVVKKNRNESHLISGPYNTINFRKNDYILLTKFGFEDLDIYQND